MKTRNILVYGVFAVILALAGIACNDSPTEDPAPAPAPEQPKAQSTVITGLFDNNASATVKGTFTDTEWAGVADKIKTALNDGLILTAPGTQTAIKNKYAAESITIIVVKNPSFANYSATLNGNTASINYAIVNDEDKLLAGVLIASYVLAGDFGKPEVAKALTPAPQTTTESLSSLAFVPIRAIRG